MNVAVGISGGVDSAVAAFLCKEEGHTVTGVTMKIWNEKLNQAFESTGHACYGPEEKEDLEDAQKVCEKLGIPLHVIDCTEEFDKRILSYFRNTYLQGRTPNPCVYCNQQLKFGILPELLVKQTVTFDLFVTGHYARIKHHQNGKASLLQAFDKPKDQSYFLYRLTHDQLSRSRFPLGELTKNDVRQIAEKAGLHVWDKEESQDFYSGDYRDLIEDGSDSVKGGQIITTEGKVIGRHNGIWNYTIGQRKGLGVTGPNPLYVTEIRSDSNTVVVGEKNALNCKSIIVTDFHQLEDLPERAQCKVRSSAPLVSCSISAIDSSKAKITFDEPITGACPGQSAVLYSDETVIGGGLIDQVIKV